MDRTPRDREIAKIFTHWVWVAVKLGRYSSKDLAHIIEHMHWETGKRPHPDSETARRIALERSARRRKPFESADVVSAQAPQGD